MQFILQFLLVASIVLLLITLKGYKVKRLFRVPLYCIYLGGNFHNKKPILLKKNEMVGAPDAIFFNPLKLRIVIGELKSHYYRGHVTVYEEAQVTLYMGMCAKWYLLNPVCVLHYSDDSTVGIKYNPVLFAEIFKQRYDCLEILRS
ncbi:MULTISPECIES: hypothetical protein [unclassified Pseudoalteromonas]|uniref:hypothetical protein n=1 Tax=unclassified Pseudoalteromonas TaxID=194690 RepID=UPI000B3D0B94|nr:MULTISPECIES: hypothetical protein [unclassified Pseudoalteromonas]MDN3379971.1 hypothetical protein [Pseudoalteromonas sp. APC 3893]MDN3388310.1 hypothetical protein [Pseudoalteromonas sp. APC 4017]OUS72106.1 hypothetical protein B5G52_09645 [Pseudoalteromonas sp. A601]